MDSPAAVCGIMDKHHVTESLSPLANGWFCQGGYSWEDACFRHEPEDLPISVDCFKFSRKDAKALFISFFIGGMLCQRVGPR